MRSRYAVPLLAAAGLVLAIAAMTAAASADAGYQTVYSDWVYNGTHVTAGGFTVAPTLSNDSNAVSVTVTRPGYQDMSGTVDAGNVMDYEDLLQVAVVGIDRSGDRVYLQISAAPGSSDAPATSGTTLSCDVLGQNALGGDLVTFPITIQNNDKAGHTYRLSASTGAGWPLAFESEGKNVYMINVPGQQHAEVDLLVQTSPATGLGEKKVTAMVDDMPIDLYVDVTSVNHTTELAAKYSSAVASIGDKVEYELDLRNMEANDNDCLLSAAGLPAGWYYQFKDSPSSTSEISEVVVPAGTTKAVYLDILPPYTVTPGDYNFTAAVKAPDGDVLSKDLTLRLKSGAGITVTTPVLSYDTKAGQSFDITLYVANTGQGAALTNVHAETTAPSGWVVTYSPNQTSAIAAGSSVKITATVRSPGNIDPSDYPLTINVVSDQGAKSYDYDVKVTADSIVPYLGAGIIVIVVVGLFLVVRKFGRR